jgi:crotonobetainyl-CoA:carnitine CoA-transferase CaiB-like acyl-CoA transferase
MTALDTSDVLAQVWRLAELPSAALGYAQLAGADPVLPSSFAVGTAALVPIAAAALAACELGHARGQPRQEVGVDMRHAALECAGWFSIDGRVPEAWDKFSGLYRCADGWVRVHANFAHHREGALRLLGLQPDTAQRADAEQALLQWRALEFEQAAADRGLVVAALRTFDEWDAHPQGRSIAAQPLLTFERIGDSPGRTLPNLDDMQRPLAGVRVLDLTRILAGPVCGSTLAAYGADVMLVNAPHLPNIESIANTSRGKLSTHVDLRTEQGRRDLDALLASTRVFVQGYRPGALDALGYGPAALAQRHPGIVCVSLSAYGPEGPWHARRGFDSLVQSATGFNLAEAEAAGADAPKALPMQILDYATGHLMAFAAAAALVRQLHQGGSWHVRVSLAQTGRWIRSLGRVPDGFAMPRPDRAPYLETSASGFGELVTVRHSAQLARTPARYARPSVPPGFDPPVWP